MEARHITFFRKIALWGIFLLVGMGLVGSAQAATQYFSPSAGSYSANSSFSVGVYTSSADQAASAFSGYISFPTDKLRVTAVSTSGSVVSIWVQEPTYSNSSGTISFEGFIPNPGFSGSGGKLLTITFQALGSGPAMVAYSGGSVLANDGLGTDITTGLGSASFTLGDAAPVPTPVPTPTPEPSPAPEPTKPAVPSAPALSSLTHPNQEAWYAQANPQFSVGIPAGITGVSVLFDQRSQSVPGTVSDGLGGSYGYQNVADGIWYFHARLKNAQGWGPAAHFPVRIDITAPTEFVVTPIVPEVQDQPVQLQLSAIDSGSGLSHYVIGIEGQEPFTLTAQEVIDQSVVILPAPASPGQHKVTVTVYDFAGNSQVQTVDVVFGAAAPTPAKPAYILQLSQFADQFLRLIKVVVFVAFMIFMVFGVGYAVILVIRHSHRTARQVVTEVSPAGEARLRRNLRALRHDIHRNLFRLEQTRRTRYVSEDTERKIRTAMAALDEFEDKITHTLQDT
jgi:hypothetical protein